MNISRTIAFRFLFLVLALLVSAFFFGCEVDSTTGVPSDNDGTTYNFAGLYLHPDSDSSTNGPLPIVYPNQGSTHPSGELITSLRLLQYGSVLEAFDSANQTWSGNISALQGGSASFSLEGRTTAGVLVQVAGTMTYSDQQSTMNASWIEPNYYGTLYAQASVPPANTNDTPSSDVTLTADPTSVALNETSTLTASGGTAAYTWSSVSFGTLSTSGSSATYTRTSGSSTDSATITVTSGSDSDTVNIAFD